MKAKILTIYLACIGLAGAQQDRIASTILAIAPSPKLNAMAGVGVALPSTDAFAISANPAQLGYASRFNNISLHFLPSGLQLTGQSAPELKTSAAGIGYRLPSRAGKGGISLGVGYINSDLNLGEAVYTDSTGRILQRTINSETSYSFSFGIGFDYFALISFGLTYKWATSDLGFIEVADFQYVRARDNFGALDLGLMLVAPIHRLIFKRQKSNTPFLNFSLGYSLTNIGGEVDNNSQLPGKPLPRTARLGYGLNTGFDIKIKNTALNALTAYWSVEANDLAVNTDDTGYNYQGMFGDIDIFKNIIRMQGDEKVVSRIGYGIDIFETIYLATGSYEGGIYDRTSTSGYGFRTKGIFRFFQQKYTKNVFSFIVDNMDFQYYSCSYTFYPNEKIRYHGIQISISGF